MLWRVSEVGFHFFWVSIIGACEEKQCTQSNNVGRFDTMEE